MKKNNFNTKNSEKKTPCMFKNCEKDTKNGARGLCLVHYVGHRYYVSRGVTTWEKLEKEGLCRGKMTQEEKNEIQRKPHKTYRRKTVEVVENN